jgi:hypothetical protein
MTQRKMIIAKEKRSFILMLFQGKAFFPFPVVAAIMEVTVEVIF